MVLIASFKYKLRGLQGLVVNWFAGINLHNVDCLLVSSRRYFQPTIIRPTSNQVNQLCYLDLSSFENQVCSCCIVFRVHASHVLLKHNPHTQIEGCGFPTCAKHILFSFKSFETQSTACCNSRTLRWIMRYSFLYTDAARYIAHNILCMK